MRSWLSLGGLGVRIVESRAKSESGEKSKEEEREREWAATPKGNRAKIIHAVRK